MNKSIATFLNEKEVLIETPIGDDFIIGFDSELQFKMDEALNGRLSLFIASLFDKYYKGDSSVIMGEITRELLKQNVGMIFYFHPDKDKERYRIGKRITELREKKGLSVASLAAMAHISVANMYRIEQGRYSIKYDVLSSIASVLGMKIDFVEL